MDQHLYSYLVLHKQLALPQVGCFTMHPEPARLDEATGLLYAPHYEIQFRGTDEARPEKRFFQFLATRTGSDEVAAIQRFHEYMQRLRAALSDGKEASIAGLGTLHREVGGMVFHASHDSSRLMPPVAVASRSGETETVVTETVTTDDRWWVYALILAGLGAAALVFYYYY